MKKLIKRILRPVVRELIAEMSPLPDKVDNSVYDWFIGRLNSKKSLDKGKLKRQLTND